MLEMSLSPLWILNRYGNLKKIQIWKNLEIKLGSRPLFNLKCSFSKDFCDFRGLKPNLFYKFYRFCIFIGLSYVFNFHNGLNDIFSIISSYSINKSLMWIHLKKPPNTQNHQTCRKMFDLCKRQ